MSAKTCASPRYHFVDQLRGWSVLIMLEGHVLDALLRDQLRETALYRAITYLNGQIAPTFLFVSGFAFAVAARRKWHEFLTPSPGLFRQFRRLLGILGMAYLLHLPTFSFRHLLHSATPEQWQAFFQVDVLHSIAVGLIALQVLSLILRRESRLYPAAAGLAIAIVLTTPLVWRADVLRILPYPVAAYVSGRVSPLFPLWPWVAYLLLGASTGYLFVRAVARQAVPRFIGVLALAGLAAGGFGLAAGFSALATHAEASYWESSPYYFLIRLGIIFLVTSGLWLVADRGKDQQASTRSLLTLFGLEALFVYVVHIVAVYGSPPYPTLVNIIGRRLDFWECLGIFVLLALAMYGLALAWRWMKTDRPKQFALFKLGFAAAMLIFFFAS